MAQWTVTKTLNMLFCFGYFFLFLIPRNSIGICEVAISFCFSTAVRKGSLFNTFELSNDCGLCGLAIRKLSLVSFYALPRGKILIF